MDDGEASDATVFPVIDFLRMSLPDIKRAMQERSIALLKGMQEKKEASDPKEVTPAPGPLSVTGPEGRVFECRRLNEGPWPNPWTVVTVRRLRIAPDYSYVVGTARYEPHEKDFDFSAGLKKRGLQFFVGYGSCRLEYELVPVGAPAPNPNSGESK